MHALLLKLFAGAEGEEEEEPTFDQTFDHTHDMLEALPQDNSSQADKTESSASHYMTKEEIYQSFARNKLTDIVKAAKKERDAGAKKRREKIREMER